MHVRSRAILILAASGPRVRCTPTRYTAEIPHRWIAKVAKVELQELLQAQDLDVPVDQLHLLSTQKCNHPHTVLAWTV